MPKAKVTASAKLSRTRKTTAAALQQAGIRPYELRMLIGDPLIAAAAVAAIRRKCNARMRHVTEQLSKLAKAQGMSSRELMHFVRK